jgi:hypothetical protein
MRASSCTPISIWDVSQFVDLHLGLALAFLVSERPGISRRALGACQRIREFSYWCGGSGWNRHMPKLKFNKGVCPWIDLYSEPRLNASTQARDKDQLGINFIIELRLRLQQCDQNFIWLVNIYLSLQPIHGLKVHNSERSRAICSFLAFWDGDWSLGLTQIQIIIPKNPIQTQHLREYKTVEGRRESRDVQIVVKRK